MEVIRSRSYNKCTTLHHWLGEGSSLNSVKCNTTDVGSALEYQAYSGQSRMEILQMLLDTGAQVDAQSTLGEKALRVAIRSDWRGMVKRLNSCQPQ